jgi:molecular chaperone GrpE (heat shock protein)
MRGFYKIPGSVCAEDTTGKTLKPVYRLMGDPRNVAHAKKVTQEKQHKAKHAQKAGAPQPAKKAQIEATKSAATEQSTAPKPEAEKPAQPPNSSKLEKSLAVLSNLKDLEFHSRANIEKLAELSLTIVEELKQKAFVEAIGAVYGAQDAFQSKILELIGAYETECTRLSGSA